MQHSQQQNVPASLLTFDHLPDAAGVALPVVQALCGNVGRNTVWAWSKKGILPTPYKAGPNRTLWNVGQLRASIAAMKVMKA